MNLKVVWITELVIANAKFCLDVDGLRIKYCCKNYIDRITFIYIEYNVLERVISDVWIN